MYAVFPTLHLRIHLLALPALAFCMWLEGCLPACLLLAGALLHEGGHLLAILLCGAPVRRIDLLPMSGLIVYDDSVCSPGQSILITASGAFAGLLGAAVAILFGRENVYALFFAFANLFLSVLNLLPWEGLDGGTLLRACLQLRFLPDTCDRVCTCVSKLSAVCVAGGLIGYACSHGFPLWCLLLLALLLSRRFA